MSDAENTFDKIKAEGKKAAGEATNDDSLKNEGKGEKAGADAKDKASDVAGNLKDKASEAFGKLTGDNK